MNGMQHRWFRIYQTVFRPCCLGHERNSGDTGYLSISADKMISNAYISHAASPHLIIHSLTL